MSDSKPLRLGESIAPYEIMVSAAVTQLTSREIARARGHSTYRGKPCKRGHSGVRLASHGGCLDCEFARKR